ncbi:MAG: polyprenyl synthetase family protein [Gammaproteobacteria bacterium]|nr:polyprenyl synthetase family protein [Gammaproteobacteria bacterium]
MIDPAQRIELAIQNTLEQGNGRHCPPLLTQAIEHAVMPGGARVRPRLCLAVAAACAGDANTAQQDAVIADAAAVSIELLHCASLIHDDLPCFDDASTRRGKPSVHLAYGEPLAVLSGDALIVMAFQALGRGAATQPQRLVALLDILGRAVGAPHGIVAGQAWECEQNVDLARYQDAKTGSLFAAATMMGAAAAGADHHAWAALGDCIGSAYQIADDILDVSADPTELGKPVGRDESLGRPNAVAEYGMQGSTRKLRELIDGAIATIPACPGRARLCEVIAVESQRFMSHALDRATAA